MATMKALVIQNGQSVPQQLIALLPSMTVVTYPLTSELHTIDPNQFDVVLLSGSSQFPIPYSGDVIAPEIDLILRCKVPLLGICYGCELIAVANSATLKDVGEASKIKGIYEIVATEAATFTSPGVHEVYGAHRWVIDMLPTELVVEANSQFGPEIIRHRTLPHVGFQFHPEKFVALSDGDELFRAWWVQYMTQ